MIGNANITEVADLSAEKEGLRKHLSKMALVPETVVSILEMRRQKERQRKKPKQSSESLLIFSVHYALLSWLVFTLYRAFFQFLNKGFCLLSES